jgi:copper chaperone CopZ
MTYKGMHATLYANLTLILQTEIDHMKSKLLTTSLFIAFFSLFSFVSFAETITSTFKVSGECGMCKKKIETSLRVKGVSKVNWDLDTKMITVTYNTDKITIDEIHERIAAVGYDTEKVKAKDEAYAKLDACCKYERTN